MQQFRRVFVKWILKRENAFVENVLTTQKITAFAEQIDHKNLVLSLPAENILQPAGAISNMFAAEPFKRNFTLKI